MEIFLVEQPPADVHEEVIRRVLLWLADQFYTNITTLNSNGLWHNCNLLINSSSICFTASAQSWLITLWMNSHGFSHCEGQINVLHHYLWMCLLSKTYKHISVLCNNRWMVMCKLCHNLLQLHSQFIFSPFIINHCVQSSDKRVGLDDMCPSRNHKPHLKCPNLKYT